MSTDDLPPVAELMANTESMLYRDLVVTELAKHSEIMHKREFKCVCGEFAASLMAPNIRKLFLEHRADAVIDILKKAGVEL